MRTRSSATLGCLLAMLWSASAQAAEQVKVAVSPGKWNGQPVRLGHGLWQHHIQTGQQLFISTEGHTAFEAKKDWNEQTKRAERLLHAIVLNPDGTHRAIEVNPKNHLPVAGLLPMGVAGMLADATVIANLKELATSRGVTWAFPPQGEPVVMTSPGDSAVVLCNSVSPSGRWSAGISYAPALPPNEARAAVIRWSDPAKPAVTLNLPAGASDQGYFRVRCINDGGWLVRAGGSMIVRWDAAGEGEVLESDGGRQRGNSAYGIDTDGTVCGTVYKGTNRVAAVWPADSTRARLLPLPALGAKPQAIAYAISNGTVVGYALDEAEGQGVRYRALRWPAGGQDVQVLPALHEGDSVLAVSTNRQGYSVGFALRRERDSLLPAGAMLWNPDGKVTDLNDLITNEAKQSVHLVEALQINDDGWIAGVCIAFGDAEPGQSFEDLTRVFVLRLPEALRK